MSGRPTISVCSLINTPPAQVAATLAPVRELVDEVVLAVDDSVHPDFRPAYAALADRVILVPFPGAFSHLYAWLRSRCRCDWILQLDADEVPGADLADAVRETVGVADVTHAWVPRRWLYPDAGRFLAQWPWRPDYSLRLFRNDPALVRFPGGYHQPVLVQGPHRHLEAPIYHGHLLLKSREQRERRCAHYEHAWPGMLMEGRPFNEAYYLPELRGEDLRTEAVPDADRAAVERLIAAGDGAGEAPPAAAGNGTIESATAEAVRASWERRPLSEQAYRAQLRVLDDDLAMVAADWRTFDVEVVNRSDELWPGGMDKHPQIRLAYRWLTPDCKVVEPEGRRTGFGASVAPGERRVVPAEVAAPARPGDYVLELDLVHEQVRWFDVPVRATVTVRPRPAAR